MLNQAGLIRVLPLIACGLAGLAGQPSDWRLPEAHYRRRLKVDETVGDEGTVATTLFVPFVAGASLHVHLLDASGQSLPHVVMERLGDRVSLYFSAATNQELHAYFLPIQADATPLPLTGGLLRETRRYGGEIVNSVAEFERAWKGAEPLGARFEEQIFSAFNPFAGNAGMLHRYRGIIHLSEAGVQTFCTASTDASFILVNGREVVGWPGNHDVRDGLDGSKRGEVQLTEGVHSLTYLHANTGTTSYALAAYIPPGEQVHGIIPPEMFVPAGYAYVGRLEGRHAARIADFQWENDYMLRFGVDELYDLHVSVVAPAVDADDGRRWQWDFGDGTTGEGAEVKHLYFRQGEYVVTLTVDGEPESRLRQRVFVRPRYGQSEDDDRQALALLARAEAQERERGIQPEGYATICRGYLYLLRERQAAEVVVKALAHADRMPQDKLFPLFFQMALEVQRIDERYELANACFQAIVDHAEDPRSVARARLHQVGLLNHCLNLPERAREVLALIEQARLDDPVDRRILRIYQADSALLFEGPGSARRLYEKAGEAQPLLLDGHIDRHQAFAVQSRFFTLKNMLAQELYSEALEEVNLLEWYRPAEKMSPYLNLLKAEALVGNGQPRMAVVCLERALLAEADDIYRPQLRLALARLSVELDLLAKAKNQIALLQREFPYSPEEIEARDVLAAIERKLETRR